MKRGTKCVVQTINLSNPKTCIRPKVQKLVSANTDSSSDPNRASDYWTSRPTAVKVCSWKDVQRKCPSKREECDVKVFGTILDTSYISCESRNIQFSVKSCGLSLCGTFTWPSRDIDTPRNEMMVFEHLYGIDMAFNYLYVTLFEQFCEPSQEPPPLSTNAKLCRVATFFIKSAIVAGLICWTCSEGLWGDSTETEDLYYRMMSVFFPDRPTRLPHFEEIKYSAFETYNRMLVKGMDIIVSVPREAHRRLRDLLFPCEATKETERKQR